MVVGVGSDIPERTEPWRFRKKFGVKRPFAIYIGRIDENKGCPELFSHFERYSRHVPEEASTSCSSATNVLPIPKHPRIRHLGYLSDEDKFDALSAADCSIMPSKFESLSMVALEAWALGKPVLANGHCDVLRGQVVRSNARPLLRDVRGVCRSAVPPRSRRPARGAIRSKRSGVLPPPLRVAGDRAQVPRHVRATEARAGAAMESAARLVGPPATDRASRPSRWCRPRRRGPVLR